jgi:hypothetical protein
VLDCSSPVAFGGVTGGSWLSLVFFMVLVECSSLRGVGCAMG